jgi:hypothetical protein
VTIACVSGASSFEQDFRLRLVEGEQGEPPSGLSHAARLTSLGWARTLEFALEYAKAGFALLPLDGKHPATPLIKRTHGTWSTKKLSQRGASEEHYREWFSDESVNVGIFCGEKSNGLVVLDFDGCDFPLRGSRLPLTPTVKTGGTRLAGLQLYYRSATRVTESRHGWGEVRGWPKSDKGGPLYVAAPPSRHPKTGRQYGWQLPLDAAPLHDYAAVELPGAAANRKRVNTRATRDELSGDPGEGRTATETAAANTQDSWLASFDADPEAVEAMASALGITVPLGNAFRCVIHPDAHPSASLTSAGDTGHWLYHDWHFEKHGTPEWLTLANVRALMAGRSPALSRPEQATWKLVLLVEAGVLSLVDVPALPLPPETSAITKHVFERLIFLLGCRWNYSLGDPAPFERAFAAALSAISEKQARAAIDELHEIGAIYVAGRHGRLRLWLPQGAEPPQVRRGAA